MTTERDWRRAYAEASGDHRSYVERYGKDEQPVAATDPRDAVIAELCEALDEALAVVQHHPDRSMVSRLFAALRRARGQG